ncbi:unnamed protein product, partial [Coregonus sp. 'balchen']
MGRNKHFKASMSSSNTAYCFLREVVRGSALEVGQEVQLKVDWERRFDHKQQHSGQHLITAIADSMFGYKTTSS